jgi:hypothetical protein
MAEPTEDMGWWWCWAAGLRPGTARCDRLSYERVVAGGRVWQQPRRSQLQVLLFSSFPFFSPLSLFPFSLPPSPSPLGGDGAEGAGIFFGYPIK